MNQLTPKRYSGRDFTEAENQKDAPCVRIVNQAMARLYWPGENPVDKQLPGACMNDASATVVGLVSDSKQDSVDSEPHPELYEPYAQHPFAPPPIRQTLPSPCVTPSDRLTATSQ
jgi:hypothetical protein